MKKILFTSLLCASFAANVNLLPAPHYTNKTEEQAASVLQAPKEIAPLITDVQKSNFFVFGPNKSLVKLFESEAEITSAEQIFFPGSALGQLAAIDALVADLAEEPEEAAKFATTALELAKGFGWDDDTKENKSASSIANTLFGLYRALDAKVLNKEAVICARYQLETELKTVRDLWTDLEKPLKVERGVLAKKIFADMFTEFRSGLTREDAQLALDKLFAHMASSGGTIKEDSLSKALKSEDQEVKNLRQKLKNLPDGKETKIKTIFSQFLKKILHVSAHKDLPIFFALMPYIDKTTLNGRALAQIGYQGYALQEKQKAEAKALRAKQDKLSKEEQEFRKKIDALKVKQEELEKKSSQLAHK